jgi:hypothetical protein
MRQTFWMTGFFAGLAIAIAGCGKSDAPELAEARGTVTYKDQPLEGASVVFIPASGPAAYGTTDADGKFTWMTRGESGAMVGPGKVVITATEMLDEPKEEEDLTEADLKKMSQSRIPLRYSVAETSGLTATIEVDAEKNEFPFTLTD